MEGNLPKIKNEGQIESISTETVVNDNLVYYYNHPASSINLDGIGVVLLAGSEVLMLG
ncbi:MAG: hypothetical protein P8X73_07190 [Ignavibacteriaceae bacterium]